MFGWGNRYTQFANTGLCLWSCFCSGDTYPVWIGKMPRHIETGTGHQGRADRSWNRHISRHSIIINLIVDTAGQQTTTQILRCIGIHDIVDIRSKAVLRCVIIHYFIYRANSRTVDRDNNSKSQETTKGLWLLKQENKKCKNNNILLFLRKRSLFN
jgi:hypothetical protein